MKAALINAYGGPGVIELTDVAVPSIAPDEILIRAAAGSFNPADIAIRAGMLKDMLPLTFPYTLGADTAGTVEKIGAEVTEFSPGDRVYAYVDFFKNGSFSDFVAVKAAEAAFAPKSITLGESAVLPAVSLTAWQGLFEYADLQAGQRVLIMGASGGVGSMAVQLARWKGAHVIGAASAKHEDTVRSLGADEFMDYNAGALADQLDQPVDVIFNASSATPDAATLLLPLLRAGGILVSAASPADEAQAQHLGVRAQRMASHRSGPQLKQIADLVDGGHLRPVISGQLPLEEIAALHAEGGSKYGKVALIIDKDLAAQ